MTIIETELENISHALEQEAATPHPIAGGDRSFKQTVARSMVWVTIVPTFLYSTITYLFKLSRIYIIAFMALYFGILLFFIEKKFELVLHLIRKFQQFLISYV